MDWPVGGAPTALAYGCGIPRFSHQPLPPAPFPAVLRGRLSRLAGSDVRGRWCVSPPYYYRLLITIPEVRATVSISVWGSRCAQRMHHVRIPWHDERICTP